MSFDNARVGRRAHVAAAVGQGIGSAEADAAAASGPVRIEPVTALFRDRQMHVLTRTNFPVMLAWAVTVHRTQGLSMDRAVVATESIFEVGMGYAALSRVRTLQGLAISSFAPEKVHLVSPAERAEYRRLGLLRGAAEVLGEGGVPPDLPPQRAPSRPDTPVDLSADNPEALRGSTHTSPTGPALRPAPPQVNMRAWCGHDLSVWPPTNIMLASGQPATLSWAYMPIIWAAAGHADILPLQWPGPMHTQVQLVAGALGRAFGIEGITFQSLLSECDSPLHLPAERQNYLMGLIDSAGTGPAAWLTSTADDIARNPGRYPPGNAIWCEQCGGTAPADIAWHANGEFAGRPVTTCEACGRRTPMGIAPWEVRPFPGDQLVPSLGPSSVPIVRMSADDDDGNGEGEGHERPPRDGAGASTPAVPEGPLADAAHPLSGGGGGGGGGGEDNGPDPDPELARSIHSLLTGGGARALYETPRVAPQPRARTPVSITPLQPTRLAFEPLPEDPDGEF